MMAIVCIFGVVGVHNADTGALAIITGRRTTKRRKKAPSSCKEMEGSRVGRLIVTMGRGGPRRRKENPSP